jgi:branched-chain amino acid transport system permease protein
MNTTFLLQTIIDAVSLGGLYALITLGMAIVFSIMRLINFAHGELVMITGYSLVTLSSLPLVLNLLATIVIVVLAALAMERAAFRPVRDSDPATLLITSFAVSFLLQNLARLILGSEPKTITLSDGLLKSWTIGSLHIQKVNALTVGVTIVLLIAVSVFIAKTRMGVQMRASAEDFGMARLVGVRANRVIAVAFALSGGLAAIAGILLVAKTGAVSPTMGLTPVLVAFVASVLGGIGSLRGAVIAGLVLGIVATFLQAYLSVDLRYFRDAFTYGVVLLVLVFRPEGLVRVRARRLRV